MAGGAQDQTDIPILERVLWWPLVVQSVEAELQRGTERVGRGRGDEALGDQKGCGGSQAASV